jgi:hypothetical protein
MTTWKKDEKKGRKTPSHINVSQERKNPLATTAEKENIYIRKNNKQRTRMMKK